MLTIGVFETCSFVKKKKSKIMLYNSWCEKVPGTQFQNEKLI